MIAAIKSITDYVLRSLDLAVEGDTIQTQKESIDRYMLINTQWSYLLTNLPVVVTKECIVKILVEKLELTKLMSDLFRFIRRIKAIDL